MSTNIVGNVKILKNVLHNGQIGKFI